MTKPDVFNKGDIVTVDGEDTRGVVMLPTDRRVVCPPEGTPEVGICCVPLALITTPVDGGDLRWIELRLLTRVDDETTEADTETSETVTMPVSPLGSLTDGRSD